MTWTCEDTEKLLAQPDAAPLDDDQRQAMARHKADCSRCRAALHRVGNWRFSGLDSTNLVECIR